MSMPIELTINGELHCVSVEPHWTLLQVLRGELGLTGTKENCLEAECGVCTVLLDGKAVNSCILLALQCRGRSIVTIEGLIEDMGGDPEHLHPLQRAFIDCGAVQCGYCIPGMIMVAKALLDRKQQPSEAEVRLALVSHLCRCGTHNRIVRAILKAAQPGGRNLRSPIPRMPRTRR